jgi:DUF4097 and DUF4098 domain-containing protein YvlB
MLALQEVGLDWLDMVRSDYFAPLAGSERYLVDETKTVTPERMNLEWLAVETVSESIEITYEAREDIEITFKGDYTGPENFEKPTLVVNENDGRIEIEIERGKIIPIAYTSSNLRLMVRVPQSMSGDLKLQSVSGAVKFRSPGGRPFLGNLEGQTVSGRIYVDSLEGQLVELSSISGAIELIGSASGIRAKTVSGQVMLKLTTLSGDGTVSTTSGDIEMAVSQELNHQIDISTTSGGIEVNRKDLTIQSQRDRRVEATSGSGALTLNLSSTSGNVTLK